MTSGVKTFRTHFRLILSTLSYTYNIIFVIVCSRERCWYHVAKEYLYRIVVFWMLIMRATKHPVESSFLVVTVFVLKKTSIAKAAVANPTQFSKSSWTIWEVAVCFLSDDVTSTRIALSAPTNDTAIFCDRFRFSDKYEYEYEYGLIQI